MGRRVVMIVLVPAMALFVYLGYNSYDARRAGVNGDVFSNDLPLSKAKTDRGEGRTADGQTIVYPEKRSSESSQGGQVAQSGQAAAAQDTPQRGAQEQMPQNDAAAKDTIRPNPPNGMVFSGTGKYQLYRQGNLTWRLNTDTGQSCVLFATDEEWKKPRVYRAGCGSVEGRRR